jgi:hypothetical protein
MKLLLIPVLMLPALILGAACTTVPEGADEDGFLCNADSLGNLVGRPANSDLGADAMRRSNSRTIRWLRPNDAATMDFRQDRLNIHLDARNNVERFACG